MKNFNIPIGNNVSSSSIATSEERKDSEKKTEQVKEDMATPPEAPLKEIEDGIKRDEFGNFIISRAPTVFFDNRVCKAFPGFVAFSGSRTPRKPSIESNIYYKNLFHLKLRMAMELIGSQFGCGEVISPTLYRDFSA